MSFLFVGDVMQHDGQIEAARNKAEERSDDYEYDDGFKFIKPIVEEYDIRIANLEVTLAGKPFKGYPQFSAPDQLAETLKNSGFNIILTSNNHSCDRGSKGVLKTLDKLDDLGLKHTGTFRSQEERDTTYPLMIHENGMNIAILNYTYGTNGLKVAKPLIVNYIDSALIRKDVVRARELNADYIICNMHWGKEYRSTPDGYQKKFEAWCYEVGVDMVIGGHPHTVQPVVKNIRNGTEQLTVWSLGNFVSNMRTRPTRGGMTVGANLKRVGDEIQLGAVDYRLIYTYKKNEGEITQYYILPDFDYNKYQPGFLNEEDLRRMNDFFSDSRALFLEHNKGADEKIIAEDSEIGRVYRKYLTSYYSVYIPEAKKELLSNKYIGSYLHTTVDKKGKKYILFGVLDSAEKAKGDSKFIEFCELTDSSEIVLVKDGSVTIVEKSK
ncbi:MAG: CapA family protein [Flavobacteriales bacterium]|nr:CapA family protein [Flavobacteriales bacterium]